MTNRVVFIFSLTGAMAVLLGVLGAGNPQLAKNIYVVLWLWKGLAFAVIAAWRGLVAFRQLDSENELKSGLINLLGAIGFGWLALQMIDVIYAWLKY